MTSPPGLDLLAAIRAWQEPADASDITRVIEALADVENPTVFAECLDELLDRADIIQGHSKAISDMCLHVVASRTPTDPARAQLRAGDALQAATRLALGGVNQLRLAAELTKITGPQSHEFAAAAIRCSAALFEQRRLPELLDVVRALSGMAGDHAPDERERAWIEYVTEDAAHELGAMTLLTAFDADNWPDVVATLDSAAALFAQTIGRDVPGDDRTERPDSLALAALVTLLRVLASSIQEPANPPDPGELRHLADELADAARQHEVGYHGLGHWRAARVTAQVAWALLARDVAEIHEHLGEDSWYDPAATLALLLDTYRATRVSTVWVHDQDGQAIRGILAPTIEYGIAARAGLTAHLRQHVEALTRAANCQDISTELRTAWEADLDTARKLLADVEIRKSGSFPKGKGSLAAGPQQYDTPPAYTTGASGSSAVSVHASLASRRPCQSLAIDAVYEQMRSLLAPYAHAYPPQVMQAVDDILYVVIDYVDWALNSTPSRAPYLYAADVPENDFDNAFQMFLATSELARIVDTEVRNRAGGRCDVVFHYLGFEPVIELKVEDSDASIDAIGRYLTQTATYQATDVTIGFLLLLDATPHTAMLPHIRSLFIVKTITDTDGVERVIIVVRVPGNRRVPSRLK